MDAAVLEVARRNTTREPLIADVFLARRLNLILGGPFFAPWDVGGLPDDVVQQILSIERVSELKESLAKVDAAMSRWRDRYARKQY